MGAQRRTGRGRGRDPAPRPGEGVGPPGPRGDRGRGARAGRPAWEPLPPRPSAILGDRIVAIRRAIHAHPELSHAETATAALVRRELAAAGVARIEPVATTGLVAEIRGRRPGRCLALRADLDALPLEEQTGLEFASTRPGVMHACGHDAHTAILLGVALALQAARDRWRGSVRCIFQPAEEAEPLGGREVVRAGCLEGVEGVLALHVDPHRAVGRIGVRAGPLMASADTLTITIRGRASHGAAPHRGADAVAAAAAVVQALQQIPRRRTDPVEPALITVGRIEGGTAPNVLAERVRLEGTVRTLDEEVRAALHALIGEVAAAVARAHGAEAAVEIVRGEPVLRNDPRMTELVRRAVREVLGPEALEEIPRPELLAEDFAFYLERVPGAMFRLGVGNPARGTAYPLHHPAFVLDEAALPIGADVLWRAAWLFLEDCLGESRQGIAQGLAAGAGAGTRTRSAPGRVRPVSRGTSGRLSPST